MVLPARNQTAAIMVLEDGRTFRGESFGAEGETFGSFEGLYLATSPADAPLERLVVNGLGFRERTTLQFTEAGIVFMGDRYLPPASITGIGRASWTIDRGVEPNGLSVVNWMLGDDKVDSYFRLDDPEGFITVGTEFMKRVEK